MEAQERRFIRLLLVSLFAFLAIGCSVNLGRRGSSPDFFAGSNQTGVASYYHCSLHGRRTANGERYDKNAFTAAHKYYPFGTLVRVTNLKNGASLVLRINDRGPFIKGRIIDVSKRAAHELGFVRDGITRVDVQIIKLPTTA
jgi:rare lipoprotein A